MRYQDLANPVNVGIHSFITEFQGTDVRGKKPVRVFVTRIIHRVEEKKEARYKFGRTNAKDVTAVVHIESMAGPGHFMC